MIIYGSFAVCVSGMLRALPSCLESFTEFVQRPNDADLFYHVYYDILVMAY